VDTQDRKPEVPERLQRVGVTDLKTIVQTRWKGCIYRFIPKVTLTIDLPGEKKGAHMSRLVEAISESIEEESAVLYGSLEELERHMLDSLAKKHPHSRGEVRMETELVVKKTTPVSKKQTMETYDIAVSVLRDKGVYSKTLEVNALGSTVCPHAMEHSRGKSHIQRAKATLTVETVYDAVVELEDLIKTVEQGFSSPSYTLLKTEDEKFVVERMHANPRFVEDVCRAILAKARQRYRNSRVGVRVVSYESIHPHNVIAEAKAET